MTREVNFITSETLLGDNNHNINLISGWPWVGIHFQTTNTKDVDMVMEVATVYYINCTFFQSAFKFWFLCPETFSLSILRLQGKGII